MYDELINELRNRRVCIQSGGDLERDFPVMREAADAIEKLQAINQRQLLEIAVLSKPRWIPVTERLPEIGQRILAVGRHGRAMYTATYSGGIKETAYKKANHYKIITGENGWRTFTYWMPLPEPPKEETE